MKFMSSTRIESIAAGNRSGSTRNKVYYLLQRLNCGMLTLKNGDLLGYLKKETGMVVDARATIAWIRTGLALMGFGFVVASFNLFLREIALTPQSHAFVSTRVSLWVGTALLLIGALVNITATVHHFGLIKRLNRGAAIGQPSGVVVAVALGLLLTVDLVLMS
jgi:putative membrane protein